MIKKEWVQRVNTQLVDILGGNGLVSKRNEVTNLLVANPAEISKFFSQRKQSDDIGDCVAILVDVSKQSKSIKTQIQLIRSAFYF